MNNWSVEVTDAAVSVLTGRYSKWSCVSDSDQWEEWCPDVSGKNVGGETVPWFELKEWCPCVNGQQKKIPQHWCLQVPCPALLLLKM